MLCSSIHKHSSGLLFCQRVKVLIGSISDNCVQTDTASVLMEAIGYIKFLQDQVEVMN
jgi:hypothetical protein